MKHVTSVSMARAFVGERWLGLVEQEVQFLLEAAGKVAGKTS